MKKSKKTEQDLIKVQEDLNKIMELIDSLDEIDEDYDVKSLDNKIDDILLVGGGIIPKKDVLTLEDMGVGKLFGPGTPVQDTVDYITNWVKENRR